MMAWSLLFLTAQGAASGTSSNALSSALATAGAVQWHLETSAHIQSKDFGFLGSRAEEKLGAGESHCCCAFSSVDARAAWCKDLLTASRGADVSNKP